MHYLNSLVLSSCLLLLQSDQSSHISLRTPIYRVCEGFHAMYELEQFSAQSNAQYSAERVAAEPISSTSLPH